MKYIFILMAVFFISTAYPSDIVINEIMYNDGTNGVEFVELYNNTASTVSVEGWYILDDNDAHQHCVLSGSISAGGYVVITNDMNLFTVNYPGVTVINPNTYGANWALGNSGDMVRLFDNSQNLHDQLSYDDGQVWPGSADGNGPSLELLHPGLDNSIATSWDPSMVDGGTPGEQNSVFTLNVAPTCKDGRRSIELPGSNDDVNVFVTAFDNEGLDNVKLFVNSGSGYSSYIMYDDGTNGDVKAGDSLYTGTIPAAANGTIVKYYAVATDLIGQTDNWPNNAPQDYHAYTVGHIPPKLRITEVLAVNNTVISDQFGEFDDCFEIQNQDDQTVNIGGMFVGNALGASRDFELPDMNLAPGDYVLIWADNDLTQGALHANFRLSSSGESVALFESIDKGNVLIHGWKYGLMSPDISMGFVSEESNAPEYLSNPTPGFSNSSSALFSLVCINEFQSTSDFGGPDDWVEIYNRGSVAYDLSGCFLSDNRAVNTKWSFPQGTTIEPGEYLVVYEDALKFGFSSAGDDVIMMTAPDSVTGLDFYDFGEQTPDQSEGRTSDGASSWSFFTEPTLGTANKNPVNLENGTNLNPKEFALHQNYPNPFNPQTTISFDIPVNLKAELIIYNVLGKKISSLVKKDLKAGEHRYIWKAQNYPNGVYFYQLKTELFTTTKKMILLK